MFTAMFMLGQTRSSCFNDLSYLCVIPARTFSTVSQSWYWSWYSRRKLPIPLGRCWTLLSTIRTLKQNIKITTEKFKSSTNWISKKSLYSNWIRALAIYFLLFPIFVRKPLSPFPSPLLGQIASCEIFIDIVAKSWTTQLTTTSIGLDSDFILRLNQVR